MIHKIITLTELVLFPDTPLQPYHQRGFLRGQTGTRYGSIRFFDTVL